MSTPTRRPVLKQSIRAIALVLSICAVLVMAGCSPLPTGQTPSPATASALATQRSRGSATPATPRPIATSANAAATQPASAQTASPVPSASEQTSQPASSDVTTCEPTDDPAVAWAGGAATAPGKLPAVCISGFSSASEVEVTLTTPDGETEAFMETVAEDGTALVHWAADLAVTPGTYTVEAYQDDLYATTDVEVAAEPGSETSSTQEQPAEPTIEVSAVDESGSQVEVVLSGFEPYQEVPLQLWVAADEDWNDYDVLDSFTEQVDEQGKDTFSLDVPSGDYPTSTFAVSYLLDDGTLAAYGVFEGP
jgi:hypothetical protein